MEPEGPLVVFDCACGLDACNLHMGVSMVRFLGKPALGIEMTGDVGIMVLSQDDSSELRRLCEGVSVAEQSA